MTSSPWSTHTVELGSHSVTKRFRRGNREQCEREWRALTLFDRYAPGLVPEPRAVDFTADEPTVVMSRLPGEPLRGQALGDRQTEALAAAVTRLHSAVPPEVLTGVPLRPGRQHTVIGQIRSWAPRVRGRGDGKVVAAMDSGLAWLARSGMEKPGRPAVPRVFGSGDGNLANYLWDGSRVRVVDFEDSGLSDRAFELAEITEHVAGWVDRPLDVVSFLDRFDLTAAERARLGECRRLLALVWLFLLALDDAEHPRNPPGTVERQADRLAELLG
ncbi:phosphotransferase family protein [Streptomyces celluloflavus]|uniref:phosphotransferase family protein n=1 Tax=Streptomyces celluloflavus TaxID=58344 RepID=UPI0036DE0A8E